MVQLEIRTSPRAERSIGGLRVVACRREVGEIDGGVSVYVFADERVAGDEVEVLRLDLFRNRPHYHAPAERQEETRIHAEDPIAWGIDAITTRAPSLAEEAGHAAIAARLDVDALAEAGPALRSLFDGLEPPSEVSHFEIPKSVLDGIAAG